MPAPGPLVVVTGAAGAIGAVVGARLHARWDLRLTDLRASDGIESLDVTDAEECRAAFAGADAVVHLAANPDPNAGWEQLHAPNVVGAHVVAAAARAAGVRRLVLASSLQAVSAYPDSIQRRTDDPPRPANLYGATKAWTEALGAWVVATSDTSVVALRIGYFSEHPPTGADATPRNLGAWLSHRDCAELIRAAVESSATGFVVANGISANRHRAADLTTTESLLAYHPQDDAWTPTP